MTRLPSRIALVETLAKYVGLEKAEMELDRVYATLGEPKDATLDQEKFEKIVAMVESSLGKDMGEAMARAVITGRLEIRPDEMGRFYQSFMRMRRSLLERQRKAERLNESLARLKELYESVSWSVPMGLCSMDMDMKITTWNMGMEKLTGIRAEDAVDTHAAGLLPDYLPLMKLALKKGEQAWDKRLARMGFNGQRLIESVVASPLLDRFGVLRGLLLLVEDVTSHAILEESAQRAEKLSSVGQLAAGVAHEVGNPLTSIWTLAQELSGPEGENENFRKESLALISHHVGRINQILKSLVDYSRHKDIVMAPRDIPEIIEAAVSLARLGRKAAGVEISVMAPQGLPQVMCDADQIEQVLINLLFNAADASRAGGKIAVRAAEGPAGFVTVTVEDEGSGISAQTMERLFTPFFTTKPVGAGSGLGLFVCYNIIEGHGGEMKIESEPGAGSKIGFSLRAAGGDADV